MIDGHIHIEKQNYDLELINNMVKVAISKGLDELNILDHTHKFKEFAFLYIDMKEPRTKAFYDTKLPNQIPLQNYIDFIKLVKSKKWPIKLNFGLEVCYAKVHEIEIKEVLKSLEPFKFDFLIGSIHFIDGICIDLCKEIFLETDVDKLYKDYFQGLIDAIHSRMFDVIGHLDLIKKFDIFPSYSLTPYFERLAEELEGFHQMTENNSGLIRHGYPYPGMMSELIEILKKHNVKFHKSSDAHEYTDIGRVFDQIEDNL